MSEALTYNEISEQWSRVLKNLRTSLGDSAFKSWLKPVAVADLQNGTARLFVPTRFMKDWIEKHYIAAIEKLWKKENPQVCSIKLEVNACSCAKLEQGSAEKANTESNEKLQRILSSESLAPSASSLPQADKQLTFFAADDFVKEAGFTLKDIEAPLDKTFTFDNFVKGESNEFALLAAKKIACSAEVSFSPFFLTAGVGLGKTHLMQAIANYIKDTDSSRRVLYMSAEKFMYKFIESIKTNRSSVFKELLRSVDVLLIDDIQFIAGKDATQTEFFHTFNALMDSGKQIVLSSDTGISGIKGLDAKLKSRFTAGLEAGITCADYDLRLGILNMKAKIKGFTLPAEIADFIASSFTNNARELEGALNRLIAHSELLDCPLNLALAEKALKDMLASCEKHISVEDIQGQVADYFKIKLTDLRSVRKQKEIALPRQVAMYLAKELTTRSLPDIARRFERDHATVMHAVKKIENLISFDNELRQTVVLLKQRIAN